MSNMLVAGMQLASNWLLKIVVHECFAHNEFSSRVRC